MALCLALPWVNRQHPKWKLFDSEGKYLAMLYRAFIDDSADRNRERVIVAGAIIGNEKEWKPFYKPWKDRLAQDGLEYYKDSPAPRPE